MGNGMIYRIAASDVAANVVDPQACSHDLKTRRIAANISLKRPTSIVVASDGFLYVTNNGSRPVKGEVLRVIP
jgi:glucose/arabinose dehydrogenase